MACVSFRSDADKRITIQSKTTISDVYGGRSVTWTDVGSYWAMITPMTGREVFSEQMQQSRVNTKIKIRYQSNLKNTATTSAYRIIYDGRVFSIKYIRNLADDMKSEGTQYQEIFCEENYPEVSE